jgi:hypothetical protein
MSARIASTAAYRSALVAGCWSADSDRTGGPDVVRAALLL